MGRRIDAGGWRRYVDAHWASARLLVEVDGSHHRDEAQWAADMLRQNHIWIAGDKTREGDGGSARRRRRNDSLDPYQIKGNAHR